MRKILLVIALVAALLMSAQQQMPSSMQKLFQAMYGITNFYVDTLNDEKIVEAAIKGMVEQLDPHSSYTDAAETREMEEPLQGEFSGIGIQFNMKQDTLYVIQTIAGGPSERVGIL
ncbi:MAG: peptidase S41, partial [Muribaculaceae bacterium]|nr:peptidase S41 [Muribaculaceae bacterium]